MHTIARAALGVALSLSFGCEAAPAPTPPPEASPAAPSPLAAAPSEAPDEPILGVGQTPDDLGDGASGQFGAPFRLESEPIPLRRAIELAEQRAAPTPVRVSASIEKVCLKKGCWMTLNAPDVSIPVRVKMKDYAFFVSRNTAGADAILEGIFERREIPQEEAQHYADDEAEGTGKPARVIEGPQQAWQFMADAVRITRAS